MVIPSCDDAPFGLSQFHEKIRNNNQCIWIFHFSHVHIGHIIDKHQSLDGGMKIVQGVTAQLGRFNFLDDVHVGKLIQVFERVDVVGQ